MPHFFRAIRRQPPKLITEGDNFLQAVQAKLIADHGEHAMAVIALINKRRDAFYNYIDTFTEENDRQPFIQAYIHFAKSLKEYIDFPNNIQDKIDDYHDSNHYYPVGGENNEFSYTFSDQVVNYIAKAALLTLVASLLLIPFNLPAGLIVLAIAATVFIPSAFYAIIVTKPKAQEVQKEETELFLAVQKLVNPVNDASLKEQEDSQQIFSLRVL